MPVEYSPGYGKLNEEDIEAMGKRAKLLSTKTSIVETYWKEQPETNT